MRLVLASLSLLSLATLPIAAHADTVDNFVLTGNGHTVTWSLPALESIPSNSPQVNSVTFPTTLTVDNVTQSPSDVTFATALFPATMDNPILAGSTLVGPQVANLIFGPPGTPTIGVTFDLGTFNLMDLNPPPIIIPPPTQPPTPVDYTLTITQAAATPEPSSLILLTTGVLLLFAWQFRSAGVRKVWR